MRSRQLSRRKGSSRSAAAADAPNETVPGETASGVARQIVNDLHRGVRQRLRGWKRQSICLMALLPVFAMTFYMAYCLRFDAQLDSYHQRVFQSNVLLVLAVKALAFGWFGVYQGWSRHVTFHDFLTLAHATVASSMLMALGDFLLYPELSIPRSVFLMDWGSTLLVVGGLRALFRLLQEWKRRLFSSRNKVGVLIVGADRSGESLLRALRMNESLPYRVVGFISDNEARISTCIGGVPVLGAINQTCRVARRYQVTQVLIAAGDLTGRQVRKLVEECQRGAINVRVLPGYEELIKGTLATKPRPVSIEDLLRREPVRLELNEIREWIDGQVVMVTGSAGSIGSEVCRQLLRFSPRRIVMVDRSENGQFYVDQEFKALNSTVERDVCIADVNDERRMSNLFMRYRPAIVFHAAAYKHVPLMESNPGEAIKNTTLATYRLANLADEFGVQSFVMISTDKAVNPTNVMGACKRVAELYVQSMAQTSRCRFVTVRFGNVLDSAGSVVPIFREQIARGGPVTVTDPRMQRYFMTIPEAAQLVIQAGTMGQGGEIFVLDMGEPVRILDLATDVIRLSGLKPDEDIKIEFVGLRPGEKLYEELHVAGERHLLTRHPKIMVAESSPLDLQVIRAAIERMQQSAEQPFEVVAAELQQIVPQYQPFLSPDDPSLAA